LAVALKKPRSGFATAKMWRRKNAQRANSPTAFFRSPCSYNLLGDLYSSLDFLFSKYDELSF